MERSNRSGFCKVLFFVFFIAVLIAVSSPVAFASIDTSTKVLLIGDSHTAGPLGSELSSLIKSSGAQIDSYGCVAASASHYVNGGFTCNRGSKADGVKQDYQIKTIDALLAEHNPNLVIVSLGANYLGNPAQSKALIDKLQGRACIWIGPPMSPEADSAKIDSFYSGIQSVIGSCILIDSRPLTQFNFCGDKVCCCDANVHFDQNGAAGIAVAKSWAQNAFSAIQGVSPLTIPPVPGAPAPGATGGFLQCDGGSIENVERLSGFKKCYRYKDIFEKYAQANGLYDMGMDLLFIFQVALGESGCNSGDEMRAMNKNTADGGILQVDNPCLKQHSCPTIEQEIDEGTKELAGKMKEIQADGFTGEDAATMLMFSYNRGSPAYRKVVKKMREEGKTMLEAADEACQEGFGKPGSPANRQCGTAPCWEQGPDDPSPHCWPQGDPKGKRCDYEFYCGKDSRDAEGNLYAVHYATKRIDSYKEACEAIGGQPANVAGAVVGGVSGAAPASTLAPGFTFGINASVLAPYSVIPSFTLTIPSIMGLFDDAIMGMMAVSSCSSDVDCVERKLLEFDSRPEGPFWLAKYAGKIMPSAEAQQMAGSGILSAMWTRKCETPSEFVVYGFAETLSSLQKSINNDCVMEMATPSQFAALLSAFPGLILDTGSGSTSVRADITALVREAREEGDGIAGVIVGVFMPLFRDMPTADLIDIPGVSMYIDDGEVKPADNYVLDFNSLPSDQNILFYRESANKFVMVEQDQAHKYANKSQCNMTEKYVKFCVFKHNMTVWKYDAQKNDIINKSGRVRFAYVLKERMVDVESFEIKPAVYTSGTVMLRWKRIASTEVPQYSVFYSSETDSFVGSPSEQYLKDTTLSMGVTRIDIDVSDIPIERIFTSIALDNIPKCVWDDEDLGFCSPQYEATNSSGGLLLVQLEPGTVYHDKGSDSYIYILTGIPNNQPVSYGLIGIAEKGEKSPTLRPADPLDPAFDYLPPAPPMDLSVTRSADGGVKLDWVATDLRNIDGSMADDVDRYEVFCTSQRESNYPDLLAENAAPFIVNYAPFTIDGELFGSKCTAMQTGVIVFPVDAVGNKFEWNTTAVRLR